MQIEVINKQRSFPINRRQIANFAVDVLDAVDSIEKIRVKDFGVSIVFVTNSYIQRLNRDFRAINKPTDVLSFSYSLENPKSELKMEFPTLLEEQHLGDIVISTETAAKYAEKLGLTFELEVKRLVVHGLIHLCGYDHETDNGEMSALEKKVRRRLLSSR
ncbi:MAG: rRNA maturation RNase YbeY [Blastocatellia bacterium]|nr:rRNA maturation RNase YbeY [Blastocatellia bacterium]